MLDLAPDIERTVLEYAAEEGVSVNELMARTFPSRQPPQTNAQLRREMEAEAGKAYAALGETEEEKEAYRNATVEQIRSAARAQDAQLAAVFAYINAPKEKIIRRNAPSIALLQAQLAEAEKATPEEIAQADAEWEEHEQRMNAHRAVTGERPLFIDGSPANE